MKIGINRKKNKRNSKSLIISLVLFACAIIIFLVFINILTEGYDERQKDVLETTLTRDITICYVMEGAYPESLEHLKEQYNLVYDEDRLYVDYRYYGSNIRPDIQIIEIGR